MMQLSFLLNGKNVTVDVDPQMPLLWVVRDVLGLKGTKFGCGRAFCGACTLHVNGETVRSCSMPASLAAGAEVVTIEGLSPHADDSSGEGPQLHPVQQAWIEENVPQCGYCQPGFMMAAAVLLDQIPDPSDEDIRRGITNLCRCGTHTRILKAIRRAAQLQAAQLADTKARQQADAKASEEKS